MLVDAKELKPAMGTPRSRRPMNQPGDVTELGA
jgi:hypothetical protein